MKRGLCKAKSVTLLWVRCSGLLGVPRTEFRRDSRFKVKLYEVDVFAVSVSGDLEQVGNAEKPRSASETRCDVVEIELSQSVDEN